MELQLGRRPMIDFSIEVLCKFGRPAVVANAPFSRKGEPNPNVFYLTCPYLRRELAVLEERGWIERMQSIAEHEHRMELQVRQAQRSHAELWRRAAAREWPGSGPGQPRIAAAGSDLAFKCLHAHAAWALVHETYIPGSMILGAVGDRWCRDDRCASLRRNGEERGA